MTKVLKAIWSVYMIPKNNIVYFTILMIIKITMIVIAGYSVLFCSFRYLLLWPSLALLTIYIYLLVAKCLKAIDKHILHSSLFSSDFNYHRLL